jgi:hypothetical protein
MIQIFVVTPARRLLKKLVPIQKLYAKALSRLLKSILKHDISVAAGH